jgi:WhiB family redox-sensing transcriptional regulator
MNVGETDWEFDAACRPYPTSWWFSFDEPENVEAFLVCRQCPVAEQCLTFAVERPALVGIWAATTVEDRVQIRRRRRVERRRTSAEHDRRRGNDG